MGEYFEDENYSDTNNETEEDEDNDDDDESSAKTIDEIKKRRDIKEQRQRKIKKEIKERIGKISLFLFGDPSNRKDIISLIDKLNDEINDRWMQNHPMTHRTRDVIQAIRELQVENNKLLREYQNEIVDIGTLLDDTIKLYDTEVTALKKDNDKLRAMRPLYKMEEEKKVEEARKEVQSYVTEEMVEEFMRVWGNRILEAYNAGIEREVYDTCLRYRKQFIDKGTVYFANVHTKAPEFAATLLDKYAKAPWSVARGYLARYMKKKFGNMRSQTEAEPNQTQTDPLKEKTLKTFNQSLNDSSSKAEEEPPVESSNEEESENNEENA